MKNRSKETMERINQAQTVLKIWKKVPISETIYKGQRKKTLRTHRE
jgi:hypothetical protein